MDYLEYKITSDRKGLAVEDYLEKHNKKNNLWWKSLKGIQEVYKTHLDIFHENANKFLRGEPAGKTPKTVKSCPAIGNAFLNKLFLVKAPCDIFLSITKEGVFYSETPDTDFLTIDSHTTDQFYTKENNIFDGYFNIKFCFPILMRAKSDLMFLEPQYHTPDFGIKVLNGVIEKEYSPQPLNINTLIKVDELRKDFVIKKGTVLSYLWSTNSLNLKENNNLLQKPRSTFFGKYK